MLENLIYSFIENIGEYNNYTVDQIDQAKYSLKLIVYEIIKMGLILLIFHFLGYFKESLLIISIMSITKPFIGGYHEDTQLKCFMATLILVLFILLLAKGTSIDFKNCIILNLISIFSIYNKAPIINEKMPITREDLIKRNRLIGLSVVFSLSILSIILFNVTWFSRIIVWTILVQAILMFNKYKGAKGGK
ncbi:MAG: accessory regulator AgrB [Clostridium sartagoforme]|nr:accessory regulator AgrB [Clostridium sartagoforme]